MLWVSITCLILMIVGVTIAVSLEGLSDDATLPLSILVGAIGFFLWFCSFGAVMDIASMRSDMDDSLRTTAFGSQFAKAPFPRLPGVDDDRHARHTRDADLDAQRLGSRRRV